MTTENASHARRAWPRVDYGLDKVHDRVHDENGTVQGIKRPSDPLKLLPIDVPKVVLEPFSFTLGNSTCIVGILV